MPFKKKTQWATVLTMGVINENGAFVGEGVPSTIDTAVQNGMFQIAGRNLTNQVRLKDVVITPLNAGGMTFLAVTVIAFVEGFGIKKDYE